MTKDEFIRPYLLLVYQPWGKRYGLILPEGQMQSELYYSHLRLFPAEAWLAACEKVATTFDHWPSVSELKLVLQPTQPPPRRALPAVVDAAPDEYPPRLAYLYSKQHDITLAEAWKKIMPTWLREHPNHPDHDRTAAMLARLNEGPSARSMPTYQDDPAPRREFVTDIHATGTRAPIRCRRCNEEREVFVCWCREEACKPCLAGHMQNCRIGSTVNSV